MFELIKLAPQFEAKADAEFLKILIETNRVRYDWGNDCLWVWPGDTKNPDLVDDARSFFGEEFHGRLYAVFGPGLCLPTSAGFVVSLLACGLNVEIATKEPFEDEYLEELVEYATEQVSGGKVGTVTQFVPIEIES